MYLWVDSERQSSRLRLSSSVRVSLSGKRTKLMPSVLTPIVASDDSSYITVRVQSHAEYLEGNVADPSIDRLLRVPTSWLTVASQVPTSLLLESPSSLHLSVWRQSNRSGILKLSPLFVVGAKRLSDVRRCFGTEHISKVINAIMNGDSQIACPKTENKISPNTPRPTSLRVATILLAWGSR